MKKPKAKKNTAKVVETKQDAPKFCKIHIDVVDAAIKCMANSISKTMTIHEVSQIIQILQASKV